ncbi:MAG TPA: hypothetical protein VGJ81_09065 [Thermoanaerobaculia bacterium]
MIAEDHFDEETLIAIAEDFVEQDTHPHLVECSECREAVGEYRSMLVSFTDSSTWDVHPIDDTPNPQTIANLRAYVDQTQREDAEAEPLVAELLAGPREEWMPRLTADEKYRTAGVVRKLIAAMPTVLQSSPADAVCVSEGNLQLAREASNGDSRPFLALLGAAWREHAYALFYAGEMNKAQEAVERSIASYSQLPASSYDLGRVDLVAAQLFSSLGRIEDALRLCIRAELVFKHAGDEHRVAMSRAVRAYVLSKAHRYRDAAEITHQTIAEYASVLTQHEIATLTMNLGFYERETGEYASALERLSSAGFIFEAIGSSAEAARMRWNVAAVLRVAGNKKAAIDRLQEVIADFEKLGMLGTAAVASLDLAELLLDEHDHGAVEKLCRRALDQFASTGLTYSARAMTAIAYLNECCVRRVATSATAGIVKSYIRQLPALPDLLFVPAPDGP